jgi:hypothetical protein
MHPGGIEKFEDAGPFEVGGGTIARFEVAAYGAGYAVLVCLAYVYEQVAVFSAAVEPFFQDFSNLRVMCPEASGTQENEVSGLIRRIVNAQLQPPGCTEI